MDLVLVLKSENFYKQSSSQCVERLTSYTMNKFSEYKLSKDCVTKIKCVLKVFVSKLLEKWKKSNWTMDRFMKSHSKWLMNDLVLPAVGTINSNKDLQAKKTRGRPAKSFEESSLRTKRRVMKALVSESSPELLCSAARASLTKSGKRTAAKLVSLALTTSPRRYKRMKNIHDTPSYSALKPYSPEEALALIIDSSMGKEDYIHWQKGAKSRGANIYPPYNVIAQTKRQCYPNNIKITETEVQIPVQDILDHTIQRLAHVQQDVLLLHHDHEKNSAIKVVYKWGLDGSGGHSIYKQCFANNSLYGDTNIILCTIVPLQMSEVTTSGTQIFWQNPSPSSSRYNRIIRLQIEKETKESVKHHYEANIQNIQGVSK
ncbi:aspartyl/lysyl-trna synthetase [Holotrichia oblita]|uniref:Aspartyl/lysyl-trna synthetase n=1 Tax=Holotrichia oblita TaxID=644536 RepID=A0ACB9TE18_HOLOL|nr:aspartyl/lysyl-trna synthetase [Holotrichia oblita]